MRVYLNGGPKDLTTLNLDALPDTLTYPTADGEAVYKLDRGDDGKPRELYGAYNYRYYVEPGGFSDAELEQMGRGAQWQRELKDHKGWGNV